MNLLFLLKKKHELSVNFDEVVHDYVFIDKMRLKQVIKNILLNAVQYTDNNGNIRIKVVESRQKFGEIYI